MEELIKQAFIHVDIIGPYVHQGHYDLVSPDREFVLPQVWETIIKPGMAITMHMWPIPEPPPTHADTPTTMPLPPPLLPCLCPLDLAARTRLRLEVSLLGRPVAIPLVGAKTANEEAPV